MKEMHPDGFAWQVQTVSQILAAAALGYPHTGPVGRLINRSLETVHLNKAFQQVKIVVVLLHPVRAQTPLHLAQKMTPQVRDNHPG